MHPFSFAFCFSLPGRGGVKDSMRHGHGRDRDRDHDRDHDHDHEQKTCLVYIGMGICINKQAGKDMSMRAGKRFRYHRMASQLSLQVYLLVFIRSFAYLRI